MSPEKRSSWHGAQRMKTMLRLWRWEVLIGRLECHRLSLSRPGGLVECRWTGFGGAFWSRLRSWTKKTNKDSLLIKEATSWKCYQLLIWAILPKCSPKWECFLCLMSLITSCPSSTSSMSQVSVFYTFCTFLRLKMWYAIYSAITLAGLHSPRHFIYKKIHLQHKVKIYI